MKKGFINELEKNVVDSDKKSKTYLVPSKREHIELKIDNNIFEKLKQDDKLEVMCRTLLRTKSKRNVRERININRRNYRIFI